MGRHCVAPFFANKLGIIRKINQIRPISARMALRINRFPNHYGYGELKLSRYLVLYMVQIAWFVLGMGLFWGSLWPSTCTPDNVIKLYSCSVLLPEVGGWQEAALLTWLWSTPMLIALEISRRWSGRKG